MQAAGLSSNRIDMVFMGDGYTSSEIGTTYAAQVQGLLSYMFNGSLLSEPFGRYRNFFNIHSIDVVSNESGADDPSRGILRDTALDASYSGRALNINLDKVDAIEQDVLRSAGFASEMRFILVNSEAYGGAGYDSGIYSAGNEQAYEIALHEIAHAFTGLGDEYDYGAVGAYAGNEPFYANVTKDPAGTKWAKWLGYNQPSIGTIGAYEGAYYHATGVYRPSLDSKMKTLGRPFDVVSREQFVLKFYEFVDPLDGYTNNWVTHHNPTTFFVDTVDPAVIKVDWTLDGKTFANLGETFHVAKDNYGFGTHTLQARAYDPTDWVRGDRSSLEQTVSWVITNDFLLTGDSGADHLRGNAKANEIQGRAGNDKIWGGSGNDKIWSGDGNDMLLGGTGRDVFVFDTRPSKFSNRDRIVDFSAPADSIWLDNKIFTKLGAGTLAKPRKLSNDMFVVGSKAKDREDRILYDKAKGVLLYDADGAVTKIKPVEIATLKKNLSISFHDFFVI
nr:M64 family metallopeptidase [Microvirga flocculans]